MRTITRLFSKLERDYRVEGEIVFEFTPAPGRECSVEKNEELRAAVKQATRIHPWIDWNDYDHSLAPSFSYLSDSPTYQYHNISPPELHVWFRLVPGIENIRRHQIHAYEKYLKKLAEELSKKDLEARSVRSIFRLSSVKSFRTY